MILCQKIVVEYDKRSRGADGATARADLPKAYPLPQAFFGQNGKCHCVYMWQNGKECIRRDRVSNISAMKEMEIVEHEGVYDIYFTYDSSIGKPVRTFQHAKKAVITDSADYLHSTLKEKAFTLDRGQTYGRMLFNGCLTDFDTGQWYYQTTVVNIIHTEEFFDRDVFMRQQPDVVYRQLESL